MDRASHRHIESSGAEEARPQGRQIFETSSQYSTPGGGDGGGDDEAEDDDDDEDEDDDNEDEDDEDDDGDDVCWLGKSPRPGEQSIDEGSGGEWGTERGGERKETESYVNKVAMTAELSSPPAPSLSFPPTTKIAIKRTIWFSSNTADQ